MNVLILTPDAVGSTLLQRLITIYMQFHEFGRPVINLHELTNGLVKYYSPEFNREILGKPTRINQAWGYYQSLQEVVELLDSVDHYKTSRLAQYHIRNRQDNLAQQIPFYEYLNDNFFIIACRRQNLFEHALSWGINKITKRLNVYDVAEKINNFFDLYRNPVDLDIESFVGTLNDYREYLEWSANHFSVASYFYYEQDVPNIEQYILNLPVFGSQSRRLTWQDTYGQEFNDWNRCHHMLGDIGTLALELKSKLDLVALPSPNNPGSSGNTALSVISNLPQSHKDFLSSQVPAYQRAGQDIAKMQQLGILVTSVPMKKQTLAEKKFVIRNFDQCLDIYNSWIAKNPGIAEPVTADGLVDSIQAESAFWQPPTATTTLVLPDQ